MSRTKGLSYDQKRDKLLEIMHETREFYNFKELEKLGPKKGIISQSVKEVLQSLVDDNLIGSGQYYWSFPQSAQSVKNQHESKMKELEKLQAQHDAIEKEVQAQTEDKADSDERNQLVEQYEEALAQRDAILLELSKYSTGDPVAFQKRGNDVLVMRKAAIYWTECLSDLMSHAQRDGQVEQAQLLDLVELKDDFEDLEQTFLPLKAPIAAEVEKKEPPTRSATHESTSTDSGTVDAEMEG